MFPGLKSNIPELLYSSPRTPISLHSVAPAAGGSLTAFVEVVAATASHDLNAPKMTAAAAFTAPFPKQQRLTEETQTGGEKIEILSFKLRSGPRTWQSPLQAYPIIKEGERKKDVKNGWQHFHVCSRHLISPSSLPQPKAKLHTHKSAHTQTPSCTITLFEDRDACSLQARQCTLKPVVCL